MISYRFFKEWFFRVTLVTNDRIGNILKRVKATHYELDLRKIAGTLNFKRWCVFVGVKKWVWKREITGWFGWKSGYEVALTDRSSISDYGIEFFSQWKRAWFVLVGLKGTQFVWLVCLTVGWNFRKEYI